jgi:guanylate kinase
VGKTTIARELLTWSDSTDRPLVRSVSVTTRAARPGEEPGVDYLFVSEAHFAEMVDSKSLLEHTEAFGHRYGTPRAFVETQVAAGTDVLLFLDGNGCRQLAVRFPRDTVSILLLPPSISELERRLHARAGDTEDQVRDRLAAMRAEIGRMMDYDYAIVNRKTDATVRYLNAVRRAWRGTR